MRKPKRTTRNILTARKDLGKFSLYGDALKFIGFKDGLGLEFYFNKDLQFGLIRLSEKSEDNYEPRQKSLQPARAFKSKPLYKRFKDCFKLTENVNEFEIKEVNGAFVFKLIEKKKKSLKYY